MLRDAFIDEKLQQMGQYNVNFNIADVARAGLGRDFAQVIQPQHQ
jgi:hypothetical protein